MLSLTFLLSSSIMKYLVLFCFFVGFSSGLYDKDTNLECQGKIFENVTMTAYYPEYADNTKNGFLDKMGRKLRTLQDYLDDRTGYVTLSMDDNLGIPYGTEICIPELNKHFGHRIRLQVRDSSSDLTGSGFTRADICVRSEIDSYDICVNRKVTLVFVDTQKIM